MKQCNYNIFTTSNWLIYICVCDINKNKKGKNMYLKYIKPTLDFCIAFVLLILLSPVIILVIVITFFDLGLPIYNEIRHREGKHKKPFIMYKIRTKTLTKDGDPQYTKTSKKIDNLRLNELLQLINVLKGEMALVGPRPFIPEEELPDGEISEKRYLLKPGITGLAQISGGRNIFHKQKLLYDDLYYDNINFWLDCKIVILTIIKILKMQIDKKEDKSAT